MVLGLRVRVRIICDFLAFCHDEKLGNKIFRVSVGLRVCVFCALAVIGKIALRFHFDLLYCMQIGSDVYLRSFGLELNLNHMNDSKALTFIHFAIAKDLTMFRLTTCILENHSN